MRPSELNPGFTFDTFVVGSANRLASAAARRVAETPGVTYNPLFIYSTSGLGKTHLMMAIGHQTQRLHPNLDLIYAPLEEFMEAVMRAIEAGERDSFRERVGGIGLLLLDDIQFLAGRHRTQEELLRVWDIVSANGGQVVLTSDRPPQEIDGLDDRLISRFSGGLIVDIGAPDYETRAAIARRKAEERGQALAEGVIETLARIAFGNVRELQGALNRLIAAQELEERQVEPSEVAELLGRMARPEEIDEFGAFLAEITDTLDEVVGESEEDREPEDRRSRRRHLPTPPPEHTFELLDLPEDILAVRAAGTVADYPAVEYNPLVIQGGEGSGRDHLLAAIGNRILEREAGAAVAFVEGSSFISELIDALEHNDVENWRESYRGVRAFLLSDLDALAETERAQDELFHLFDVLLQSEAQLAFSSSRPPAELEGLEERLRTRLEAGLVVVLPGGEESMEDPLLTGEPTMDPWFLDREKVVWDWPYIEDTIVEEWS